MMARTMTASSTKATAAGRLARRILVVDDDHPSREGLRAALRREGHTVDTATDAWQAIVVLRAQSFDIAVVDLDLPSVHGVDLGGWDVVRLPIVRIGRRPTPRARGGTARFGAANGRRPASYRSRNAESSGLLLYFH